MTEPPIEPHLERTVDPAPGALEGLLSCDLCRRELVRGDAYYPYLIGVDDEPSHLGIPGSVVETAQELIACSDCNPLVVEKFEQLLAALWSLRAEDPTPAPATTEESPL